MDPANCPNDAPEVSALFNDPNADITFRSSDNVLFKINKTHLNTASSEFGVPELVSTDTEVVPLDEPSEVLEVLFQFVHPCLEPQKYRQPSVIDMEISLFFMVSEAAEKYIVFGATNTFVTRMHQLRSHYPIEILNHSSKHGYPSLADQVAILALPLPLDKVVQGLTHPGLIVKWLLYYNKWLALAKSEYSLMIKKAAHPSCPSFIYRREAYLTKATFDPRSGACLPPPHPSIACFPTYCHCDTTFAKLSVEIQGKFADIPKFSSM